MLAVVLGAALHARSMVRSGRAYEPGPYRLAGVAVDVQVLLGAWLWYDGRWWEAEGFLRPWAHPGLALLALALVHLGLRRASNERWAAEAYAIAGRTLLAVLLLVGGAAATAITGT